MRYEELTIEGRNAVLEAFRSGKTIDKLFVQDGCKDGPIQSIVREARKADTIISFVPRERLDQMSETGKHQGVIAHAAAYEYAEVEDILKAAEEKGEPPFIFLLDGIEDPHNLGAIIRTANLAGAHGVIIPKHRAAGLTATVAKTSAGALNYTPVAKVTNLVKTMEDLKGKKVAYSSGTSSEDILNNTLTKAGMTMSDIQAVDMDASGIVTAMISGGVDACATWSPNSLKIMEEIPEATKLADNMTFKDTTVSLASWIVTPKYAEENQDTILRFTKALFKGMDYAADDHYEETAKAVADITKTDEASVFDQRGDADWLTGKEVSEGAADGTVENYYKIQQENFIAGGQVEKEVPVADYVMLDNMIEAGK